MTDLAPPGAGGAATPYQLVGGSPFFERLVAAFYRRVAGDPLLRPMYPDGDLGPAEERLRLFLEQFWGGPGTYSETRGHPRLRARHFPFPVDTAASDRWLELMRAALDEQGLLPELDALLWKYFAQTAPAMINRPWQGPGDTPPGQG